MEVEWLKNMKEKKKLWILFSILPQTPLFSFFFLFSAQKLGKAILSLLLICFILGNPLECGQSYYVL